MWHVCGRTEMHTTFWKGKGSYLDVRDKLEDPGVDGDNIKPTLHKQKLNIYCEFYATQ
jgi:hypothetical protein